MSEFAQELDTMPKAYVHWSDKKSFDLSLLQPQFIYQSKYFKFQLRPIIGMDLIYNKKGLIMKINNERIKEMKKLTALILAAVVSLITILRKRR